MRYKSVNGKYAGYFNIFTQFFSRIFMIKKNLSNNTE